MGESSERRHSTSSMGVESALCEQWRSGSSVGGGRKRGRYGFSVLGLMGCAAMIAASEHFVNTVRSLVGIRLGGWGLWDSVRLTRLDLALDCSFKRRN